MSTTHVLVAIAEIDLQVETISRAVLHGVARRPDMKLLAPKAIPAPEVNETMACAPRNEPLVLVMVSQADRMDDLAEHWLAERANLLVAHIGVVERTVRVAFRGPGIDKDYLVAVLRELLERAAVEGERRTGRVTLRAVEPEPDAEPPPPDAVPDSVIDACVAWLRKLFGDATTRVPEGNGWAATRASVLHWLEPPAGGDAAPERSPELVAAQAAFANALTAADPVAHPLAAAHRRLGLGALELRMLALGLAPELDPGFQRTFGFLLDDFGRRVGTLAMYCWLLGESAHVRMAVARSGALSRWLLFDPVAGDEPLRLDPFLARWLLGDSQALGADPRVRRVLRTLAWDGASLLDGRDEEERASDLVDRLRDHTAKPWIVLHGDDPTAWRALIELGATVRRAPLIRPVRVDAQRLAAIPVAEVEDSARRIGRMALLTGAPVVIDVAGARDAEDALAVLFATLAELGCRAAVLCDDQAFVVRLLGRTPFELVPGPALTRSALAAAVRKAAVEAEAHVTEERAGEIATRYPLGVDALEHAMRLARARPLQHHLDEGRQVRFTSACKEFAAEGASHLADRIEPLFSLDDVVLPSDRREQLVEIVDNVRLAPQVLDAWHFREQLPYGRGVTALFAGPPGTGKTMAAIGIARRLGVQILRLDLSRVVSKYIGDTEKHLDCLFRDGHRSGSAIVVDEAEALMGKRSEVKDAHDRYANIEVAYLLQRMEAYEGLVILTTNMQQSFDPAFLRRLRFVVDFPRPDAEGRERIWRQCLPEGSHDLDDQTFRQLGRRIDLTGGHIRQITLRAAFLAAAAGLRIGRAHVVHAVRAELTKLGMPAVEIDSVRSREAA